MTASDGTSTAPDGAGIGQRRLGRTDLTVSTLGFGTAPLGGLFQASSQQAAQAAIGAALAGGISHFDSAPSYGCGLAEVRLGAALRGAGPAAASTVVSSKVGRLLVDGGAQAGSPAWAETGGQTIVHDASRDGILRSVEDSLARTGLETLDILFLHDPDKYAAQGPDLQALLSGAYAAMEDLRQQGRVSAIGIGVNAAAPCAQALQVGAWDCFMLAGTHSVLVQEDDGLLDACHAQGTSVHVAAPFLSGVLAGGDHWRYGPVPDAISQRVRLLRRLCDVHGVAVEAAALQFPLFHPAVCNVVVGMRSAAEVAQNLAGLRADIPADLWHGLHAHGFISDRHYAHVAASLG